MLKGLAMASGSKYGNYLKPAFSQLLNSHAILAHEPFHLLDHYKLDARRALLATTCLVLSALFAVFNVHQNLVFRLQCVNVSTA